jgi:hypothetical protein
LVVDDTTCHRELSGTANNSHLALCRANSHHLKGLATEPTLIRRTQYYHTSYMHERHIVVDLGA